MTRDESESGVASGLWRQMSQCFFAVVNCAHQRFRMARRFRLGDVIVERFEIIIRIERECAQPAEGVCVEPAMRISFAERFELSDGDLPRFSQCLFVLRRPLRAPGGRERAARAHEHRHFSSRTFWKFLHYAIKSSSALSSCYTGSFPMRAANARSLADYYDSVG